MDLFKSMETLDDDTLELGELVAEALWWENNIYKQYGNVLMWHRDSEAWILH